MLFQALSFGNVHEKEINKAGHNCEARKRRIENERTLQTSEPTAATKQGLWTLQKRPLDEAGPAKEKINKARTSPWPGSGSREGQKEATSAHGSRETRLRSE